MNIAALFEAVRDSEQMQRFERAYVSGEAVEVRATPGMHPFFAAQAASSSRVGAPLVLVCATTREAEDRAAQVKALVPDARVEVFPAWETLPHERLSPRSDTVARRLQVLHRLAHPETDGGVSVVVVPVRALIQPMATGLADLTPVTLSVGADVSIHEVARALTDAAYMRVDMVDARGQFAVRGGILDVFAPTHAHPVRVEFFGDEIDEIRYFAVADQRSHDKTLERVIAPACREILLSDDVRARARAAIPSMPGAADMLARIADGSAVEGMEALAPLLVGEMTSLMRELPEQARVLMLEPQRLRARVHELVTTTQEFLDAAWSSAAAGGAIPVDVHHASFLDMDEVLEIAHSRALPVSSVSSIGIDPDIASNAQPHPGYGGSIAAAARDLRPRLRDGWRIALVTGGAGTAKHVSEQLLAHDTSARATPDLSGVLDPSYVRVAPGPLTEGVILEDSGIMVLTERDMTGKSGTRRSPSKKLASKRRASVDPLQLRPGDYVVHSHHGVGKFVEMTSRTVKSGDKRAVREYIVIEYASSKRGQAGDRLYVPSDQLDRITKYVGGEAPTLNKMGGSDWAKTKSRARKAIREIADELVRLYSARHNAPGYAFSPDTPWQRELEDAFEYIETPDQLSAIEDVKADMEKPRPMDRLVCGDVGYGKTEVAVRAAFKAVQDGKQVALLCPTTLLSQQHVETFNERFAGFPVTVRGLSRFQSKAESEATIAGLRDGSVDVVIGTHRLLTGQVRFKDLGLIIIDEEQRFGVEHKETLKALRTDVDVLSMSATPIPRTLEMAVTGIRELSTLATAPEERHPVLTYVGAFESAQVKAAIRRETLREGQVFYIHNRVDTIDATAQRVRELVPDARVEVAHGKMNEQQLERVILDFWEKRFDVLVCTTIVETGLDISNANTLIVEDADKFGLSQLHQLRGRVGRSRERGYAYFLYRADKPLTETAHDRLSTLATHSELGAGMQVAMKDLEIRGAGNLLGGEQSGHIAGVGFDLYVRMVAEAVNAFKGHSPAVERDIKVDLPVNAHIPESYVESERLRLEAYSKISAARSGDALETVRAELQDRYGNPPPELRRLFAMARLRLDISAAGLDEVVVQGKMIRMAHVDISDSLQLRARRIYPGTVLKPALRHILLPFPSTQRVGGLPLADDALIDWVREALAVVNPEWGKQAGVSSVAASDDVSKAPSALARRPASTGAASMGAARRQARAERAGEMAARTREPRTTVEGRVRGATRSPRLDSSRRDAAQGFRQQRERDERP